MRGLRKDGCRPGDRRGEGDEDRQDACGCVGGARSRERAEQLVRRPRPLAVAVTAIRQARSPREATRSTPPWVELASANADRQRVVPKARPPPSAIRPLACVLLDSLGQL